MFFPPFVFPLANMPTAAEFASCLQKIKYGFNLLVCVFESLLLAASGGGGLLSDVTHVSVLVQAELNGDIENPTAPEYVHHFFSMLAFVSEHVGMTWSISCGRV